MSSQYTKDADAIEAHPLHGSEATGQATRHPLENSPEETIKRMRALPERAAKLTELIRALGYKI